MYVYIYYNVVMQYYILRKLFGFFRVKQFLLKFIYFTIDTAAQRIAWISTQRGRRPSNFAPGLQDSSLYCMERHNTDARRYTMASAREVYNNPALFYTCARYYTVIIISIIRCRGLTILCGRRNVRETARGLRGGKMERDRVRDRNIVI